MKRLIAALLLLTLLLPFAMPFAEEEETVEAEMVASESKELKPGDKGALVRFLQTRLRDLRYYTSPVTGNYLKSTAAAVKAVQEAYGLPATGEADMATLEIIYGDCHRPLARGDEGKDVKRLQTRLAELGYYMGNLSGKFAEGTETAVGRFQADNSIEKTGKADIATLIKVYSDDIYMPTPDPNATPTAAPDPTPVPDTTFKGKLSYGSKSAAVKQLQEQLAFLTYFSAKKTGGFYKKTLQAVKAFQKQNGLVADGIVDENTWKALYAPDAARPKDFPKPTAVPTPIPYAIEVDVNNQLVKVYERDENGEFTVLNRAFWCSTGTTSNPSQPGTYTLTKRRALWATFPNWGGGTAQYWVQISPEIAFHSVLYNSSQKQVNMRSVNRLGRRASHGCIRLTLQDAKWIYQNAKAGVEVLIHENGSPDPELKYACKPGPFSKEHQIHLATPVPTPRPPYDAKVFPVAEKKRLKLGSEGPDVFWLQCRLQELGFYKGTVTGQFREGTRDALKAYQRAFKLNLSASTDDRTWASLMAADTAIAPMMTPLPTDSPAESPAASPQP